MKTLDWTVAWSLLSWGSSVRSYIYGFYSPNVNTLTCHYVGPTRSQSGNWSFASTAGTVLLGTFDGEGMSFVYNSSFEISVDLHETGIQSTLHLPNETYGRFFCRFGGDAVLVTANVPVTVYASREDGGYVLRCESEYTRCDGSVVQWYINSTLLGYVAAEGPRHVWSGSYRYNLSGNGTLHVSGGWRGFTCFECILSGCEHHGLKKTCFRADGWSTTSIAASTIIFTSAAAATASTANLTDVPALLSIIFTLLGMSVSFVIATVICRHFFRRRGSSSRITAIGLS